MPPRDNPELDEMSLSDQEILSLMKWGNKSVLYQINKDTRNELVEEWESTDRKLPTSEASPGYDIVKRDGELEIEPLVSGECDDVRSREFVREWTNKVVERYRTVCRESDFPASEFKVLILWSPEWEDGDLVTGDDSMTTRRIAEILYPDTPIESAMNTVRGKKGSIKSRVEKIRKTYALAKGEVFSP